MATELHASPGQELTVEGKVARMRELFADAPEVGRKALHTVLHQLASDASQAPPPPVESAGRVGARLARSPS